MAHLTNPINQPSLEVSSIRVHLINEEISKLYGSPPILTVASCFICLSIIISVVSSTSN
jgi:hypothetical protein